MTAVGMLSAKLTELGLTWADVRDGRFGPGPLTSLTGAAGVEVGAGVGVGSC